MTEFDGKRVGGLFVGAACTEQQEFDGLDHAAIISQIPQPSATQRSTVKVISSFASVPTL